MRKSILSISLLTCFAIAGLAQEQKDQKNKIENTFTYQPYSPSFKSDATTHKVKGIILLIGDGMGITQVASGFFCNNNELAMLKLKSMGYARTYSKSGFTTDSAASGTTYGCGKKTKNGMVGMDADSVAVPNVAEKIKPKGYYTGIVTTDNIAGATPSAFYAHVPNRGMTEDILGQLSQSKLDFFAGGSESLFEKYPSVQGSLKDAGFTVVTDYTKLSDNKSAKRLGLFTTEQDVKPILENRGDYLPSTTRDAIDYLAAKKGNGFFLMVEGAQIDWGSHNNDAGYTVTEVIDFDRAVSEALKFADSRKDILVIVTADHETGGMTLPSGNYAKNMVNSKYTTGGHTGMLVPVFAYGPYSQEFRGLMENTDIHDKILTILTK